MQLKSLNFKIIISVVLICIASIVTISGVVTQLNQLSYSDNNYIFVVKQMIGMLIGICAIIFIMMIDLKKANFLFNLAYWILFGMLFILAFEPPGTSAFVKSINGASGWFQIPIVGITIQPVEFMKIALFFKMASISYKYQESNDTDISLFKSYLVYAGIPLFLVLIQPDAGGVILLGVPSFILFLTSLKNKKYARRILFITIVFVISVVFLLSNQAAQNFIVNHTPIYAYQLDRIDAWLDPFNSDKGYQLQQSLILMGSAGIFGRGFGYSGIPLPEPHTDVIFSEFVGMFGWLAGIILILLFLNIIIQIYNTGIKSKDLQYRYLCLAFGTLFIVQVFENIGMMIGLFPITGIVLPFMSYGVSALLTYSIIIGIVLKIGSQND